MSEPQPRRPILIVEDDRNIASLVEQYLQKDGFETLSAGDGDNGLALARRENPALVILDINLPGWTAGRCAGRCGGIPTCRS